MDENEFRNKMENLKKPEVSAETSRRQIKLAILTAKKSARWGIWFLVVPIFFFACVAIKEFFHWNWGLASNFLDWMAQLDRQTATWWLTPVLFVLLPAAGAVVNLLAILHFVYDKAAKELLVTIKIKWLNIVLALISISVVGIIFLYGLTETAAERAIRKYEKEWKMK